MLSTSHVLSLAETVMHAKRLEDYGADVIYLADSCGTMFPDDVKARFDVLRDKVKVPLGYHGHNNLTLAVANSLQAAEFGATYIDGACRGMGAGAGNAQIEVLVGCLKRKGFETGIDFYKLMDLAEDVVEPILKGPQTVRNLALVIGYVGTYGSFLLHAQRAGQKFGLDPRDIIAELGRRKMVLGQEDMIIDVAYQLSQKQATTSAS
jgi:4-hydroxy 2-oxovalerate aldolase